MRKLARNKMVITVVLLLVSFSLNGPVFAGGSDETTNALLERISALEKRGGRPEQKAGDRLFCGCGKDQR